ncbi:TetR/AcrR family transcriptional regulator [Kiloniella antarctica]|uniref:TetR/AcrR family transcriptional regulator n=1 Tax=Kiloniella antarctica TaxID=1550907 RepID=A0ABW5BNA1_9PROT
MVDTKIKRGRPRNFDKKQAEAIALKLFWQDGYEATGLSKLTNAIGVGAPSLYAAFGSKAGLFAKAIDLYQAQCTPFFKDAFETDNLSEFISGILNSAVNSYTQEDSGRGCLVLDGTRNATDIEALALTQQLREDFHRIVVKKVTQLGAQKPEQLADACQIAMIGLSGAARHGLSRDRISEVARVLARGISEG